MTVSFSIFDVPDVAEMLADIQKTAYQDAVERIWTVEEFTSLMSGPGVCAMVIICDEQPCGFLMWRQVAEEAEILSLCILPEYRRQGHGHRILQKFSGHLALSSVRQIFLEVRENNEAATTLYNNSAFEIVGRRKGYYGRKQDALIMKFTMPGGGLKKIGIGLD